MKIVMTEENDQLLIRSQRRLLRRIYNGRTVPIMADGRAFLTFKDARQYLQSLTPEARDAAYAEMKAQAK
jgi:hypothetical protein